MFYEFKTFIILMTNNKINQTLDVLFSTIYQLKKIVMRKDV